MMKRYALPVANLASAVTYMLCFTACCNGVGVQGTMLRWRIHRRSVRSCAKEVGRLVHCSDQCYPSYFRTHYRRQKRWWSAYLLFFDRLDQEKVFDGKVMVILQTSLIFFKLIESMQKMCPVPQPIQVMVQKQNLEFHHTKSHFSYPYFQFMKQLLTINYNYIRMQVEQSSTANTAVNP